MPHVLYHTYVGATSVCGGGAYLKMGGPFTCKTMYHFMTIYTYKSNYLLCMLNYQIRTTKNTNITGETTTYFD
jgi:hypothetical protein